MEHSCVVTVLALRGSKVPAPPSARYANGGVACAMRRSSAKGLYIREASDLFRVFPLEIIKASLLPFFLQTYSLPLRGHFCGS